MQLNKPAATEGVAAGSREGIYAVPPDCCCWAGGGPPNPPWPPGPPVSTLTKLKSVSTYTVTGVPSDFTMCASYMALPSASVSTRMTVPPGTFCFATAVTFEAASPVSTVSSERWWPQGRPLGVARAAGADCVADGVVVVVVESP